MKSVRPHKTLLSWQKGKELTIKINRLCRKLPEDEKFGLISQLKRASVSVPVNIAEGAARHTNKEFIHFLYIAEGSLSEIDTLLEIAQELGSIDSIKEEQELIDHISALTKGLINKLKRT